VLPLVIKEEGMEVKVQEGVEVKMEEGLVRRMRTRGFVTTTISSPLAPMIPYKGKHI
jgi:hypothetical protein